MKYSHIIWDFNGTILNDIQIGIDAVNVLLKRYGKKEIDTVEEYRAAFGFPVIDYYEKLGLERENFQIYAPEWVAEYNLREPNAAVFNGVSDLLKKLKSSGYIQVLLSATEQEMLLGQIDRLALRDSFAEIIGQNSIEAHGKIGAAIEWIKREKPMNALFIGDTIHDFEVAEAIGVKCVLVSWGHQSKERLLKTGAVVIDTVCELEKIIKNGEI
ncbi:MAG: HAD family hydrolase [Ruminococcaceae bacterium]|nr:HAD family hydrolase [Oscillospiraceae bacterium]